MNVLPSRLSVEIFDVGHQDSQIIDSYPNAMVALDGHHDHEGRQKWDWIPKQRASKDHVN